MAGLLRVAIARSRNAGLGDGSSNGPFEEKDVIGAGQMELKDDYVNLKRNPFKIVKPNPNDMPAEYSSNY